MIAPFFIVRISLQHWFFRDCQETQIRDIQVRMSVNTALFRDFCEFENLTIDELDCNFGQQQLQCFFRRDYQRCERSGSTATATTNSSKSASSGRSVSAHSTRESGHNNDQTQGKIAAQFASNHDRCKQNRSPESGNGAKVSSRSQSGIFAITMVGAFCTVRFCRQCDGYERL